MLHKIKYHYFKKYFFIMKIGQKFTFYSNGKHRKALFLEKIKDKIKCIICDDKMEGIEIEIYENQIINNNKI